MQRFPAGESLEVSREISPDDYMHATNPEAYFAIGESALRAIQLAMLAAGLERPGSILDFACGHGRVLRTLQAAFPDAELTACDLRPDAVAFCADVLGARGVVSALDPGEAELGGPFDVIWSGSFLTHVDEDIWRGFLDLSARALSPGGVLVFTSYGRLTVEGLLRPRRSTLDLTEEQVQQVLADYDRSGFGFYPGFSPELRHGDAVASPAWVCSLFDSYPELTLVQYTEGGWGTARGAWAQDVVACTKLRPKPKRGS